MHHTPYTWYATCTGHRTYNVQHTTCNIHLVYMQHTTQPWQTTQHTTTMQHTKTPGIRRTIGNFMELQRTCNTTHTTHLTYNMQQACTSTRTFMQRSAQRTCAHRATNHQCSVTYAVFAVLFRFVIAHRSPRWWSTFCSSGFCSSQRVASELRWENHVWYWSMSFRKVR